ncbi:hypothetical protein GMLC_31040 [Geomonas limicola]|uniref:Uncharacterized protein n=1 Tax=Geomonas limicola TaxID=2740186 RepID=A0A6V8NA85_9BACT|nr:hypothetical protein GMLC_31040 [Geomonas limicola]
MAILSMFKKIEDALIRQNSGDKAKITFSVLYAVASGWVFFRESEFEPYAVTAIFQNSCNYLRDR